MLNLFLNSSYDKKLPSEFSTSFTVTTPSLSHDFQNKVALSIVSKGHGSLLFLLKCNYDIKLLKTGLPLFYRELLQYFQDLKNATNIFSNGEFILWNHNGFHIKTVFSKRKLSQCLVMWWNHRDNH